MSEPCNKNRMLPNLTTVQWAVYDCWYLNLALSFLQFCSFNFLPVDELGVAGWQSCMWVQSYEFTSSELNFSTLIPLVKLTLPVFHNAS